MGNYDFRQAQGKQTVLYFDTYYLTGESRVWLRKIHVNYIANTHKGRFGVLGNSVSMELHKSGKFVCAYKNSTKEAVFIAGIPMKVLKKIVLGNSFDRYKRKKDNVISMFNHYNAGFNACDRLNRVFSGKSWGYRRFIVIIRFVQITSSRVY